MTKQIILNEPAKNFEEIKKINDEGIEYWEARELMSLLGYIEWRKFNGVVVKAKEACLNSDQNIDYHFVDTAKMIFIGKNTEKEARREIKDYRLSRYACYLIAQNGDSRKQEIAMAQTYFAVKTREREIEQQVENDSKRLFIREEVRKHNKKLFQTAKNAGVTNFGRFNNHGYLGLYKLSVDEIKRKKKIGKDNILDRAGSTELAANLFRITQADDQIKKKEINNSNTANNEHFRVGRKVRNTIKDIGGEMPEDLGTEENIKIIENKKQGKFIVGK